MGTRTANSDFGPELIEGADPKWHRYCAHGRRSRITDDGKGDYRDNSEFAALIHVHMNNSREGPFVYYFVGFDQISTVRGS